MRRSGGEVLGEAADSSVPIRCIQGKRRLLLFILFSQSGSMIHTVNKHSSTKRLSSLTEL